MPILVRRMFLGALLSSFLLASLGSTPSLAQSAELAASIPRPSAVHRLGAEVESPVAQFGTSGEPARLQEGIAYQSIDGLSLTLYPYTGRNLAFLVDRTTVDADTMAAIVATFDRAYDYYAAATGRTPHLFLEYNGLGIIAVVPQTCGGFGYGCGYLGATGIELVTDGFDRLYDGVAQRNEYDQTLFYELGRNFWFYDAQLAYKGSDDGGSVTTGYAVFMRFMAMEAAGVTPGPYNWTDFAYFQAEVEGMLGRYLADTQWSWENTLRVGKAPDNPIGLGAADLFASFLFELRTRYGDDYIRRLWHAAGERPAAGTTQAAVDNFVVAASVAAGADLADLFAEEWRWPVSQPARDTIEQILLHAPPVWSLHLPVAIR